MDAVLNFSCCPRYFNCKGRKSERAREEGRKEGEKQKRNKKERKSKRGEEKIIREAEKK